MAWLIHGADVEFRKCGFNGVPQILPISVNRWEMREPTSTVRAFCQNHVNFSF